MITQDLKMADLIHLNYEILSVLKRFNMALGFGDKTVAQVCNKHEVNVVFFLEIANSFIDKDYFPQNKLMEQNVEDILFYLKNTHQFYMRKKIPEIGRLIDDLDFDTDNEKYKLLVRNFFEEYRIEFTAHIKREEERIFPYIAALDQANKTLTCSSVFFENMLKYSISDYEKEHEDIEEKLYDLKNIFIKYLPLPNEPELLSSILVKLFKLEADLNDHSRIEGQVIIPKVLQMEHFFRKAIAESKMRVE
jgi:regulator of cell morphogenesis and NO signaling